MSNIGIKKENIYSIKQINTVRLDVILHTGEIISLIFNNEEELTEHYNSAFL